MHTFFLALTNLSNKLGLSDHVYIMDMTEPVYIMKQAAWWDRLE